MTSVKSEAIQANQGQPLQVGYRRDGAEAVVDAPPEFMLVVSYNPGYQNILKSLKPSTRQRFVALEFDFPPVATEVEVTAEAATTGCASSCPPGSCPRRRSRAGSRTRAGREG